MNSTDQTADWLYETKNQSIRHFQPIGCWVCDVMSECIAYHGNIKFVWSCFYRSQIQYYYVQVVKKAYKTVRFCCPGYEASGSECVKGNW